MRKLPLTEGKMRKLSFLILGAILSFAFVFLGQGAVIETVGETDKTVYVGGMSAGFTLKSGNAQVIGFCEIVTDGGVSSPALRCGLSTGDYIYKVNGVRVESAGDLNKRVNESKGKEITLDVVRGRERIDISVLPVKEKISGNYKIGVLVRDSISGIGTVTYIQKDGNFGALGHSVVGENREEMKMCDGMVYECSIIGVCKGVRGKAGELRGMFLNDKTFGVAEKINTCGIFGKISEDFNPKELQVAQADSTDAKPGNAYIYTTVNGEEKKRFDIEIVKVDKYNKENKNYVVKISDEDLIRQTGGIVQGMSGSPILQEGKLIGAITHVFLNDPTRGYGIGIEAMLEE